MLKYVFSARYSLVSLYGQSYKAFAYVVLVEGVDGISQSIFLYFLAFFAYKC